MISTIIYKGDQDPVTVGNEYPIGCLFLYEFVKEFFWFVRRHHSIAGTSRMGASSPSSTPTIWHHWTAEGENTWRRKAWPSGRIGHWPNGKIGDFPSRRSNLGSKVWNKMANQVFLFSTFDANNALTDRTPIGKPVILISKTNEAKLELVAKYGENKCKGNILSICIGFTGSFCHTGFLSMPMAICTQRMLARIKLSNGA